jgi:hypothetical protein
LAQTGGDRGQGRDQRRPRQGVRKNEIIALTGIVIRVPS